MSFEIYLQCFKAGEPAGIPKQQLISAFNFPQPDDDQDTWKLWYDDKNNCEIFVTHLDTDPGSIHHICVERPCQDVRLWNSCAEILKLGSIVLYFPGGESPLVANESVIPELPTDMIEALGSPACVQSGTEILKHL